MSHSKKRPEEHSCELISSGIFTVTKEMSMTITVTQEGLRRAYFGRSPGMFAPGGGYASFVGSPPRTVDPTALNPPVQPGTTSA